MVLETLGQVLDAGSGVLLVLLGLFVLSVKPRRKPNLALAGYCIGLGTAQGVGNLYALGTPDRAALGATFQPFFWLAGASVLYLASVFPRPIPPEERSVLAVPVAVYAVNAIRSLFSATNWQAVVGAFLSPTSTRLVFAFALLLFAARFARAAGPTAPRDRRQFTLMSAALLVYPMMLFGIGLPGFNPDIAQATSVFSVATVGLVVAFWLWNTRLRAPGAARMARDVALLALAVALIGLVASAPLGGPGVANESGILGVSRIIGAAILAYAILKHQLLDIDVKVKWGIKQSTLGAIFIGVFFVVSNGVQTFFQGTLGPYVGIAAAGALVFAMTPLQGFADRVANKAMPGVRSLGEMSHPDRAALYREQARVVWADGQLSVQERQLLDIARERLGLTLEETALIEREVAPSLPAKTASAKPAKRHRRAA